MQLFTRLGFVFVLGSLAIVSSSSHVAAQRRVTTSITRLLAEDVTGKGHTTRVGADEDLVMLLVPLAQEP